VVIGLLKWFPLIFGNNEPIVIHAVKSNNFSSCNLEDLVFSRNVSNLG
jgi:hypothetical protein